MVRAFQDRMTGNAAAPRRSLIHGEALVANNHQFIGFAIVVSGMGFGNCAAFNIAGRMWRT